MVPFFMSGPGRWPEGKDPFMSWTRHQRVAWTVGRPLTYDDLPCVNHSVAVLLRFSHVPSDRQRSYSLSSEDMTISHVLEDGGSPRMA